MRTWSRTQVCGAAVVAALTVVSGCAGSSEPDATPKATAPTATLAAPKGEPIKIGLISQEDETVSFPEGSAAAKAAVKYLNAERGGIGGRPAKLTMCTTGDSAESAVACANKFANDSTIPLVISNTYNSAAVNKVLVGRKTVFSFNVGISDMTTPDIYTLDPGTIVPAQVLAQILKDKKAEKVAIMYTDDPETKSSVVPLAETAAKSIGLTVAQKIPVASGGDYSASVAAVDTKNVDGIIALLVDSAQCAPVGAALKTIGLDIPVASADICSAPTIVETGDVNGWNFAVTNVGSLDPSSKNPQTLEFRRVMETYGGRKPDLSTVAGYTFGHVLAAADLIAKVGVDSATPEALNAQLAKGWSADPLPYLPVSCPGAAPFIGECASSMFSATAKDGKLVLATDKPVAVDLSAFAELAK